MAPRASKYGESMLYQLTLWYTMPRWCNTSGSPPSESSTARSRSLNAPAACPMAARVCPRRFQQSGSSGLACSEGEHERF